MCFNSLVHAQANYLARMFVNNTFLTKFNFYFVPNVIATIDRLLRRITFTV